MTKLLYKYLSLKFFIASLQQIFQSTKVQILYILQKIIKIVISSKINNQLKNHLQTIFKGDHLTWRRLPEVSVLSKNKIDKES